MLYKTYRAHIFTACCTVVLFWLMIPEEIFAQGVVILEGLPGIGTAQDDGTLVAPSLGNYLGQAYRLGVGVSAALAVAMIATGGIEYMITESMGKKGAAKQKIWNALGGLFLALSSYIILNTINPYLVSFDLVSAITEATIRARAGDGG